MDIEVLHIVGCPSWELAVSRVREALDRTGHNTVVVKTRLLENSTDAASSAFGGSPTIVVDGEDLFDSDNTVTELACRVYRTPAGLSGAPTVDQIIERLAAV